MASKSVANEQSVTELARNLSSRIRWIVENRPDPRFLWTNAVWRAFGEIAQEKGWKLHPEERPFKGEFLLDFVLWEANYGPRVVCESQWQHRFSGIGAIDWAFDKLRCVKGDIKILIYEWPITSDTSGPPGEVADVVVPYLRELTLLSEEEAFLLLKLTNTDQWAHWWQPIHRGNPEEIHFKLIPLD